MALNFRQQRFAEEYVVDLNATQAAIRANYSEKTAYSQGERLLSHVEVAAEIKRLLEERSKRTAITADRVLTELARIGLSDLRKLFTESGALRPLHELDDDAAAAVSSVKVVTRPSGEFDEDGNRIVEYVHEMKLWDKNTALVNIGRHLAMFVDRQEHTGKDGGPIQTEEVSARERIAGRIASAAARMRASKYPGEPDGS